MVAMTSEFLTKAQENLKAAQLCFENKWYNACANRMYYAALQAAVAAIAESGIKQEKVEHKRVQADFNGRLLYRQKRYPAKFKSYLPDMQILRNEADYTTEQISKKRASSLLSKAKEMISCIEQKVKQ